MTKNLDMKFTPRIKNKLLNLCGIWAAFAPLHYAKPGFPGFRYRFIRRSKAAYELAPPALPILTAGIMRACQ